MKLSNSISLLDTSSLAERVYERLLTAIVRREFAGGLNLDVDKLAEKFGVSRTPIQSALARLADLGIVEIRPRRGTFVKRLTNEDFHEIFEVREMIEVYAVKKGARLATDSELAALKDFVLGIERLVVDDEYKDYQEFLAWDKQFHSMIAGLAKNRRLVSIHNQARTLIELTRASSNEHVRGASLSHKRHKEIVNALTERDGQKAVEAVQKHSEESEKIVLERLHFLKDFESVA